MSWIFSKKPKNTASGLPECLNCKHGLDDDDYYCPECGQKKQVSKVTFYELIKDFFISILNLESGFYKSLRYLFVPGRLPREFINGKRRAFFNPIRLFVIMFIIHLAVLSSVIQYDQIHIGAESSENLLARYESMQSLDSLVSNNQLVLDTAEIDSIKMHLFADVIGLEKDTTNLFQINLYPAVFSKYSITRLDAYKLTPQELLDKYEISNFLEKIVITQTVRVNRDIVGMVRFGLGNLIWCIFLTILAVGGIMKLLYWRKKSYYVEHLILLFHVHSPSFIIMSVGILVQYYVKGNFDNGYLSWALLIVIILFFLNLKFYYGQGWIKTIIKFIIIGFIYLFFFALMIFLVGAISLILYK